ncbi:AraC-like DNA-binding protein [Caulobacter ginsengisoli]|uniref:AraC-like DNA-binding protein n=1 Tax=Caulobacter ginsengisoli TaxID=400775 RepID=A0ABU0IKC2_9CAUL|nr:helix-turn-helix domain-containing protein [Caulobacter ginsengisoli]MDQ0462462.1 AraC-like DNA-binding protein [Caulobacter ginsengisoli]
MNVSGVDLFLARAGAIGGSLYREFPPAGDLREFVACTWVSIVRRAAGAGAVNAILPDGCADIMVYDDHPPRVAGPDAVTRWTQVQDGLTITAIRLRPGACRAVLGCPAERLVGGSLLLADIAPGARTLHRQLLASGSLPGRLELLEAWVRGALHGASDADRAVIAACRQLGPESILPIGEVARRLDWNVRTLHRQFLGACGYGPKHLQRIMRLNGAIRAAQGMAAPRLGDLAAAAGYADQAHMTRDFRDIAGLTPAAYFSDPAQSGWGAWLDEW